MIRHSAWLLVTPLVATAAACGSSSEPPPCRIAVRPLMATAAWRPPWPIRAGRSRRIGVPLSPGATPERLSREKGPPPSPTSTRTQRAFGRYTASWA